MDAVPTPNDPRLVCYSCGAVHRWARLVDLPDGRVVGNYSEDYRRYCEAVAVLKKYRVKRTRQDYLAIVAEKRGTQAMVELREEMLRIWKWKNQLTTKTS